MLEPGRPPSIGDPSRPGIAAELSDGLIDGASVGMALFDLDHRFLRINEAMAAMNRFPAEAHLGRRPVDINPDAERTYGHLLDRVIETGQALTEVPLSYEIAASGLERHWQASYYPVRDRTGTLVAVGAVVVDVSEAVVSRRRSELLSALARDLSGAVSLDEIAVAVTEFLASAFRSRVLLAFVDDRARLVTVHPSSRGYDSIDPVIPLRPGRPLTDVVFEGRPFAVASRAEYAERYPESLDVMTGPGDEASAWVPICDPLDENRVLAVFRLGWSAPRALSDASRRLHETLASIIALALNRVQLVDARTRDVFRAALDAMLDQVTIGRTIRDASGGIADFEIEFVNRASLDGAGRRADEMVGGRVTELYPKWRESGMFDRFVEVVETGRPISEERLSYTDTTADGRPIDGFWSLQVARLGDGYIAASRDVTATVRAEREAERARSLAEQHRVAVDLLQRAALPVDLPLGEGFVVAADHRPAAGVQPVGGDWYDCFELDGDRVALVIADVAGHGAEAAALMLQARNITRGVGLDGTDPGEVLTKVNRVLMRAAPPGSPFITCVYGIVDVGAATFSWARAGHPDPLFIGADGTAAYRPSPSELPLGVRDATTYTTTVTSFGDGESLVLYTDGLVERRDECIDVGLARLATIVTAAHGVDVAYLVPLLVGGVDDPADDIAVIGLARSA